MASQLLSLAIAMLTMVGFATTQAAEPIVSADSRRDIDPRIAGVGTATVLEGLRGDTLATAHGFLFTVSPDEQWIVDLATNPQTTYRILHVPTVRLWTRTSRDPAHAAVAGLDPNSFAKDSKAVFIGRWVRLSPDMKELVPIEGMATPDTTHFEGTFLSFRGIVKNRSGIRVDSWWKIEGDERRFGEYAWSPDGSLVFEPVRGATGTVLLRTSPPGSARRVDFRKLADHHEGVITKLSAEMDTRGLDESQIAGLKEMFAYDRSAWTFAMHSLSPSPDGKTLAAIAELNEYGEDSYVPGPQYGVLIPLTSSGDGPLVAWPFSVNNYGKIIWSPDSKRIYYYAQPTSDGGHGTVYRLDIKIPGQHSP